MSPPGDESGGLGKVVEGYIAKCTLGTCRRLLSPKYPVLEASQTYPPYLPTPQTAVRTGLPRFLPRCFRGETCPSSPPPSCV